MAVININRQLFRFKWTLYKHTAAMQINLNSIIPFCNNFICFCNILQTLRNEKLLESGKLGKLISS